MGWRNRIDLMPRKKSLCDFTKTIQSRSRLKWLWLLICLSRQADGFHNVKLDRRCIPKKDIKYHHLSSFNIVCSKKRNFFKQQWIASERFAVVATQDDELAIDELTITTDNENKVRLQNEEETVPTKMIDAIRIFFFTGDYGPFYVILALFYLIVWRVQIGFLSPLSIGENLAVMFGSVLLWTFQEHIIHERLLHSKYDWYGKSIHQSHHDKPYYHISLDPAGLLIGWMLIAHVIFRCLLPTLPLALTATISYSAAGLFYEWSHYIVHTKVRLSGKFWRRVKENHMRHHLVSHDYWFGFSLPWIDDVFDTNPDVRIVKRQQQQNQQNVPQT